MKRLKLTIYQKLLLFTLPIVCISILGFGYYSFIIAKEEMMSEIKMAVVRQAEDTARELNRLSRRTGIDVITLSQLTSIRDYNNNIDYQLHNEAEVCRKSIETFMLDFLERSRVYSGASYSDDRGMEVAKVVKNEVRSKRRNVKEETFFREARKWMQGGIYASPLGVGEEGEGMILRYATPLFNERGEFDGVMTLDLDFQVVQELVRSVRVGKTGYAVLIDQGGKLMAYPEEERGYKPLEDLETKRVVGDMKKSEQGSGVYSTPNGEHLIGYASVETPAWSLAVTAPVSDFMSAINRIKINSILVMLLSMAVAIFGISFIAGRVSRPIKALADHTRIVSNGNLAQQLEVNATDEIGELTLSFNEMTKKLWASQEEIKAWNRELEERVQLTTGQLTTERDKFEAVFQHMDDGVVVLDEFSRVIDLNSAAETYIGMEKSALIGEQILMTRKESEKDRLSFTKNLQIICQPKFEEGYVKCWEYFDCPKRGCPAHGSEELRCWLLPQTQCDHSGNVETSPEVKMKGCLSCGLFVQVNEKYRTGKQWGPTEVALDAPKRTMRIFKSPMFDNQSRFMGHVIVLQDITKDKELERLKSDFVSNVSHELRTPLTSIKSFSELILDDLETMDSEIERKFLGIIRDEAERLTRLISDLLDLQRIQADRIKWRMETIDLPQLIENSIETFSGLAKMKRIHLSFESKDELPPIHGDRDRLQQVLVNLISNAIRFSRENGQIRIEAAKAPEGVLVFVSDKGIGIPADKRERIFERFYQVDSSMTKERGGTGLGLAISKEIIEHHGGRIWVESKAGEGSKFSFVIPKAPAEGDPGWFD